ncbi:hypothetical protein NPIL_597721 [Nephila pilipes]|uniref:Uncharacterized protein n=1 Tax=Nephila pilipes TaxID=299642 RepID=A0A8X6IN59_NEPPI|nr:hypothetical protein NPIL_597721 [Nephila pilipes]
MDTGERSRLQESPPKRRNLLRFRRNFSRGRPTPIVRVIPKRNIGHVNQRIREPFSSRKIESRQRCHGCLPDSRSSAQECHAAKHGKPHRSSSIEEPSM